MKHFTAILAGLAVVASSCAPRPETQAQPTDGDNASPTAVQQPDQTKAREHADAVLQGVALSYFEALTSGNAQKATSLAAPPFSLDRRKVLLQPDEVAATHARIIGDKGKRQIPEYTVGKTDKAPPLDGDVFPDHVVYRFMVGDEAVDIYVSTAAAEVIGFSD